MELMQPLQQAQLRRLRERIMQRFQNENELCDKCSATYYEYSALNW